MHTLQDQKDLINEHIDNLACIEDVLPLLTSLFDGYDIAAIQSALKNQIENVVNNTVIIAFYETLPIDPILPLDLIQKCLSFIASNDINLVSKQFKELDAKNQALREQERLIAIDYQEFVVPNIQSSESDKTIMNKWIVRKSKPLTKVELKQEFKLTESLVFALSNCTSGDILYVEGYHDCTIIGRAPRRMHNKIPINASISIIGIGDDAAIHFGARTLCIEGETVDCVVHMKNIEFKSPLVVRRGSLWIEQCRFAALSKGIHVGRGNLHIRNCVFNERNSIRIAGHTKSQRVVNIVGCLFQNDVDDEEPCILICSHQASNPSDLSTVSMKCIGNIFKNKATYPIMDEEVEEDSIMNMKGSIIANNILQGRNVVDDVNKIYRCEEEQSEIVREF